MNTPTHTSAAPRSGLPSPMRMLRQLLSSLRASETRIEYDVIERQVAREQAAVAQAVTHAASIDARLEHTKRAVRSALTDSKSPGIIDEDEVRAIARELVGVSLSARKHVTALEALT